MKILFIYPEFPDTFWSFKHALKFIRKKASSPPLGLLTVASMLPTGWEKRLVDLNAESLKQKGVGDVLLIMGGIIPKKDFEPLKKAGVQGIFSVHSTFDDIIDFIRKNVSPDLKASA